jgi:hypothetical protein
MQANNIIRVVIVLVTALLGGGVTYAHHSADYQFDLRSEPLALQGVLTKYLNINPHTRIEFDVKTGDKIEHWEATAPSPAGLARFGVNAKYDMVVGRTYTFRVIRARDGSNQGLLLGLTLPDGRDIKVVLTPAERGEREN